MGKHGTKQDADGRWIIPYSVCLPTLIICTSQDRASICGYPEKQDCLRHLTGAEILQFAQSAWVDSWEHEPVLRRWVYRGMALYGMYGWPDGVVARIFRLVRDNGGDISRIEIPAKNANQQTFFILGAKLVADDTPEDLVGEDLE